MKPATQFGDHPVLARHLPDRVTLAERILNRIFKKKEIVNCDRDTYLHRWYVIRKPGLGLFIHKFVRSDEDRALHDHPWDFIVIPIWRGYIEHSDAPCGPICGSWIDSCDRCGNTGVMPIKRRVLPILGTRFRRGTYRHRVELLQGIEGHSRLDVYLGLKALRVVRRPLPSWSIFIRFREFRDWGFHLPEGWMQWNKFWKEKCE